MLDSPSGGKVAASQLPGHVSRFSPQREHGFCREERRRATTKKPSIRTNTFSFVLNSLQNYP
jgi:hypothetical protein